MRKKLLILGLIMMMVLTACGGGKDKKDTKAPTEVEETSKELTKEEEEKLEKYIANFNEGNSYKVELNKDNRTVNVIIIRDLIKESDITISENISEYIEKNIGKDFIVKLFSKTKESKPLLIIKDTEILEDNFKEYSKKYPEKFEQKDEYETDEYLYEYTNFEVLPPNPSYGYDKSVLAITMKFTNNSSEVKDAWFAFTGDVAVQQKGEELEGGMVPEDYKPVERENYDKEINPGESIEVVFSYELLDTNTPVKMIDRWTEGSKYSKDISIK